jgi:glycosyltransferase involved in cell wall biosynthesis
LFDRGTLVLMGWGTLEDELRSLVEASGLEERVRIVAPVPRDQLPAYTAGAAVGVIPYEPVGLNNTYSTPNKLFDYLAAGVPIAATRLPELERIVDGLGVGRTFYPVAPHEIATAIDEILRDDTVRTAMAQAALAARTDYTWERQAATLLALYGIHA